MSNKNEIKNYIIAFDIMNIIACICVVVLHVNNAFWTFDSSFRWMFNDLIESLAYFAVPVFFMLTGATLMDYRDRYSTKAYFKKRVLKTLIPFLIWTGISLVYEYFTTGWGRYQSDKSIILTVVDIIVNTKTNTIYWFFRPLFAAYLSIPVLSAIGNQHRKKIFSYAAVIAFITYSVLPTVFRIVDVPFPTDLQIPVVGGYIIFVLLGYLISNYEIDKKYRMIIYLLGIMGFCIHFFGTWSLSVRSGRLVDIFKGYTNYPTVFYSAAVFTFLYYRDWNFLKKPKAIKIIRSCSSASFGVYLSHMFIIHTVTDKFGIDILSKKWVVIGSPLIYLLSLAIVLMIKKIPILKKIVP